MTKIPLPKAEELRAIFSYDPLTGILSRRERPGKRGWNDRYANKPIRALDRHGYVQVRFGPRNLRVHRIAWVIMTGEWAPADIDHINGIRSDNRWENLRSATRSQNNHNRHTARKSQFPIGVTFHRASGLFRAYVNIGGKQRSLGYFKTEAEAAAAYAEKAPAFLGEFYKEPTHA